MRFGGVRQESVPQPAQQVREAAASPAFSPHRLLVRHRAAFLCASGGKNAHRDSNTRHAAVREQLQLALHVHSVNPSTGADLTQQAPHLDSRLFVI